jgi:hypothetical protein
LIEPNSRYRSIKQQRHNFPWGRHLFSNEIITTSD